MKLRLDLELAGADVLEDQLWHRLRLELLAVRTLEVDPFDHRHGRRRPPENVVVLRDAVEQLLDVGRPGKRRRGRVRGGVVRAAEQDDAEHDADDDQQDGPEDAEQHARRGLTAPRGEAQQPAAWRGGACSVSR